MRALVRVFAAALVAVSLAACTDEHDPISPATRRLAPTALHASKTVYASSPNLALLMVDVQGGDLQSPLRYDILFKDGVSDSPLPLPEGKGYEISLRGYDAEGVQTHQGKTYVEYIEVGENKPFDLTLESISKAEPVKLNVGVLGEPRLEKGSQIVIESPVKEIKPGESVHFSAYVLDPRGERMELDPSAFHWFVDDPHIDLFEPARPHGPQDDLNINSIGELERLNIGVTAFDQLVIVTIPVQLVYDPYIDISAGFKATCALKQSGRIDCWGDDQQEMLGDGQLAQDIRHHCSDFEQQGFFFGRMRCVPTPIYSSGRLFRSLSVGGGQVCAIETSTNAAYCWGQNAQGQLGPGISGSLVAAPTSPVASNGKTLAFSSITAGGSHTCGRQMSDIVFCWGDNASQQLGGWTSSTSALRYGAVSAGNRHTCTLDAMGSVDCAGAQVSRPGLNLSTLGRGGTAFGHACGTTSSRDVICWGMNAQGQLGRPIDPATAGIPQDARGVLMNGVSLKADQVAVGAFFTCALDQGTVSCWGSNLNGQRGDGTLAPNTSTGGNPTPNRVAGPGGQAFTRITAGDNHVCGLVVSGSIYCWGLNERGQLGIGQTRVFLNGAPINAVPTPTKVIGT